MNFRDFLDYISDTPPGLAQYLEHALAELRERRAYVVRDWTDDRDPDKPTAKACVLSQIDVDLITLDDIKRRYDREHPH
jgi:hypothetical protein